MLTDLHCHILPNIDDGAKDIDVSLKLLKMQNLQGVEQIVFTPHFRCGDISVEAFLEKRDDSFNLIKKGLKEINSSVKTKLGAEVYFTPDLLGTDLKKLCIEGTNYILVELPNIYNEKLVKDILYEIQLQNIVPIIAHIERYSYTIQDISLIYDFVNSGCLVQINASSVLKKDLRSKLILKLFRWNLAHIVSSDTHSINNRPPLISKAAEEIVKNLGIEKWNELKENANVVFEGKDISANNPYNPRKFLGLWI